MVNDKDLVDFDALELEGDDDEKQGTSQKLAEHLKFLKEKLSPEDYTKAVKDLGLDSDLSNEELLEEIKAIMGLKKKEGEEEEEEENLVSYKDFMEKCMKEGKSLKDCTAEYKEKYPDAEEPAKEEQTALEALEKTLLAKKKEGDDDDPDPDKKEMKELKDQIATLTASVEQLTKSREQEKNTAELTLEVEKLVEEKHLAPSQKEGIIKLAGGMSPEDQEEMLEFFRTTQKLSGFFDDTGLMLNKEGAKEEITPERRAELIETFKINEIIEDRGVRKKVNN